MFTKYSEYPKLICPSLYRQILNAKIKKIEKIIQTKRVSFIVRQYIGVKK